MICAAVLHDTLEDTDTSYEELCEKFGKRTADIVQELTSSDAEIETSGKSLLAAYRDNPGSMEESCLDLAKKLESILQGKQHRSDPQALERQMRKRLGKSCYLAKKVSQELTDDALLCKLSDRLDNVSDMQDDLARDPNSTFPAEYSLETSFILSRLERSERGGRLSDGPKSVVEQIKAKIRPFLCPDIKGSEGMVKL